LPEKELKIRQTTNIAGLTKVLSFDKDYAHLKQGAKIDSAALPEVLDQLGIRRCKGRLSRFI
jgi:hypothetical protein